MSRVLCVLVLSALVASFAGATPVTVNFLRSCTLPGCTVETLPFELNGSNDNIALQFSVPGAGQIVSLNSVSVTIQVYDDERGDGPESGQVHFLSPGPNLYLGAFGPNLNGYTQLSPYSLTGSLAAGDLTAALAAMQDNGRFRIRIQRHSGDFYVLGGSVQVDANVVPEPASVILLGGAGALLWALRRKLRSAV